MKKNVIIYTDGACSGNPGKGGWGAVMRYGQHQKEISGYSKDTTNNQMELMAVIQALALLKEHCLVSIYTDSKYVMNGITQWINNWKKNGWKSANKKDIKNIDLWKELDDLVCKHEIKWFWVKGHNGDELNELADKLAREEIEKNK